MFLIFDIISFHYLITWPILIEMISNFKQLKILHLMFYLSHIEIPFTEKEKMLKY